MTDFPPPEDFDGFERDPFDPSELDRIYGDGEARRRSIQDALFSLGIDDFGAIEILEPDDESLTGLRNVRFSTASEAFLYLYDGGIFQLSNIVRFQNPETDEFFFGVAIPDISP